MTDPAIQVRDLRKSFAGPKGAQTEVLKGVDFTIRRGEVFALLGSNGAGKTTIVKILSTPRLIREIWDSGYIRTIPSLN
jgi:ABC-2 type transport system ATP-binding protein